MSPKTPFAPWLLALLIAGAAGADPRGTWLTEESDAKVEVFQCGDELCGRLVWLKDPLDEYGRPELDDENPDPALRDRPIQGLQILQGFPLEPDAKGLWTGGTIYDPESGRTYSCRMSLAGDQELRIRGYLGFSLLGRTTVWTRTQPLEDAARP